MLPENKVQEIHEFANLFFYRVIDRLKQAGAPDKEYVQPKINFFYSLSQEERARLSELTAPISHRIHDEYSQYIRLSEEERASRKKTIIQELLTEEERNELSDLKKRDEWGENTLGTYCSNTDDITLDGRVWNDGWETLAHELLHAVRHKVLDTPELNKGYDYADNIKVVLSMALFNSWEDLARIPTVERTSEHYIFVPAEVIELFGKLEVIVRADIFSNHPKYAENVELSERLKLNHFEKSYDFFREGIKARFSKMVSNVVALHRKMLECKGNLNLEDTLEYAQIKSDLSNRGMDGLYLNLICGIPDYHIHAAYSAYNRLCKSIAKEQEHIKMIGIDNIDWEGDLFTHLDEQKEAEKITEYFNIQDISVHHYNCECQTEMVYLKTMFAINEFQPELVKSWPELFLMSGKEVEEKYIAPIRKRIEELKAPL